MPYSQALSEKITEGSCSSHFIFFGANGGGTFLLKNHEILGVFNTFIDTPFFKTRKKAARSVASNDKSKGLKVDYWLFPNAFLVIKLILIFQKSLEPHSYS